MTRSAAILAAGSAGIPARSGCWRQDAARTRRLGSLRYRFMGSCCPAVLALGILAVTPADARGQLPGVPSTVSHFGQLPLYFEANHGQTDPGIRFVARGRDNGIYLSADSATIALKEDEPS